MIERANSSEVKKAIYLSIAGLAFGAFVSFGILPSTYERQVPERKQIEAKKLYSPLSYLELTTENGRPKRIFQKSLLTDSIILGFDLNSLGKVERMIEDSSLWGKPKMRISSPEKNPGVNWRGVNQTAQSYIAYLEEK